VFGEVTIAAHVPWNSFVWQGRPAIIVPAERSGFAVQPGEIIGVPLYDGRIRSLGSSAPVFRHLATARLPSPVCISVGAPGAWQKACSSRVAVFKVVGNDSYGGGQILVYLRLPGLREQCVSCRVVHYLVKLGA
jgi:hypothetical protein